MTLKLNVSKTKNVLLFGLLFFAAMNFQAKFFYFVFISLFVVIAAQGSIKADPASLVYFVLCSWMALYNFNEGILSMLRCFAPFCFYLVGLNIISPVPKGMMEDSRLDYAQRQGYTLLVVISLGSFAHYTLNYINNFGKSIGRNTIDIWSGAPMAATGQVALASLMLGLATAMLFLPLKKWHRYVAAESIAVMMAYNLVLAGRTMIVILFLLLLVGLLYPKMKNKTTAQKMKSLLGMCLLLGATIVVYRLNIGEIQKYIEGSLLFSRFGGSLDFLTDNSERANAKIAFLTDVLNYPFGGLHMRQKYGYAHDLLLDGYDEYGFMVLFLLIAILAMGGVQLYRNLRFTAFAKEFKLALLLINLALWLEFAVEPILAGMQWLFSCYCLVNGCMTGMNRAYFYWRKRSM